MRWPWQKTERRSYTAIITQAIEQAAGKAGATGQSAAIECASGFLSRELAAAEIEGPEWVRRAVTRTWLDWLCRETVRNGEALSIIRMNRDGDVRLLPASHWHWTGRDPDEMTWRATVSAYGPSGSMTREIGRADLIRMVWSTSATEPHRGRSVGTLAGSTAALAANAETSLSQEARTPVAALVALPEGLDGADAELANLKAGIANAQGRAIFVESFAGGAGDRGGRPDSDWKPQHLGPAMTDALNTAAKDGFNRLLASAGVPPSLFDPGADGTSQRESLRRARLNFTIPFCRRLEDELSARLDAEIRFKMDPYALDLVSRAQVVSKLTQAGVDLGVAMAAVNLEEGA